LPEVGPDHLREPGGITHVVMYHEDWCSIYSGKGSCSCGTQTVRYFAEPKRT
jgi:hypothetical protein